MRRTNSKRDARLIGGAATIGALALFAWLPLSSEPAVTQEVASRSFLQYPNTTVRGVLAARISTSIQECARTCGRRAACEGFDHDAATSDCQLFTSVTSAETKSGWVAGTRTRIANFRDPVSAPTEEVPPVVSGPSAWTHNGSLMRLLQSPMTDGSIRVEIIYDSPRDSLRGSGIEPGSILFVGRLSSGYLTGRARLTSRRCSVIEYDVSGRFDSSVHQVFVLAGAAPHRDKACRVDGWLTTGPNANLSFEPN